MNCMSSFFTTSVNILLLKKKKNSRNFDGHIFVATKIRPPCSRILTPGKNMKF